MNQEIVWVLKTFVLPPGILVILGFTGFFLARRLIGKLLLLLTLTALYLFSTPFLSKQLMSGLEIIPALTEAQIQKSDAQAIVLLGAGRQEAAPEYHGADTVNPMLLERLRYAAWLSKRSGLPIIPSGGSPLSKGPSEAELSRQILQNELGAKILFLEDKSRTTREEALILKGMLKERGIQKIMLVTHAWHMLRSLDVFVQAGIDVIPAPMGFAVRPSTIERPYSPWLPSAKYMQNSYYALHEYLGRAWYQLLNKTGRS
ncbi:MAG: YdcF family protein [Sedimenticola sp.]|nr:YdcF family protein [Sedimenticola sp.]